MEMQEIRQLNIELMETAEVAYLTTINSDGFPQIRAMLNLRSKSQFPGLTKLFDGHAEDLLIYLTTNTSSTKMNQIKTNPAVAVYFCKPSQFHGLMLGGAIEIVTDPNLKKQIWQDGWEMYYPSGVDDPEYTVLRLLPVSGRGWYEREPFEFNLSGKK